MILFSIRFLDALVTFVVHRLITLFKFFPNDLDRYPVTRIRLRLVAIRPVSQDVPFNIHNLSEPSHGYFRGKKTSCQVSRRKSGTQVLMDSDHKTTLSKLDHDGRLLRFLSCDAERILPVRAIHPQRGVSVAVMLLDLVRFLCLLRYVVRYFP